MSSNLTDLVKSNITPELLSVVSSFLNEEVPGISKAIDAAIPTLLSGLANKAVSEPLSLSPFVKQAAESDVLENLPSLFAGDAKFLNVGSELIAGLLGNNTGVISSLISSYAGIKPSSATTLLNIVSALVLGVLGKDARSNGLDAARLASLLSSQKAMLNQTIPAELNVSALIQPAPELSNTTDQINNSRTVMPAWALPLLLLVSGALLIWYFIGRNDFNAPEGSSTVTEQDVPVARQTLNVELPDGVVLNAFRGGIEDQLVNYLKDPSTVAGKEVWFDFDNLNFATGTADISPESQAQINNIGAILKAFPKVRIKIGGYTDKTGDESSNLKLSEDRANAVKTALTAAGVGEQITGAEGYGSQYAKIPAEAPETSRVVDRRVSISVREK